MSAVIAQFPKQSYSSWDAGVGMNVQRLLIGRTTQERLAEAIGLGQPELSKRIRGRTKWKGEELSKIAVALDVTLTELCTTD